MTFSSEQMMSRFSRIAASAAFISAAALMAGCSSSGDGDSAAASSTRSAPAAAVQPSGATQMYSDAQVQAFVAARTEIQALPPNTDQVRIGQILSTHSLAPDVYNAIATRAQTDQTLSNRIAAVSVGTEFSDAQLQSFIAASTQINPLSQSLATAPAEQQPVIAAQIRSILQTNNLTIEAYNGIAAQAQSDPALAARINALAAPAAPADATAEPPATTPQ
jgi:hypothetical protein